MKWGGVEIIINKLKELYNNHKWLRNLLSILFFLFEIVLLVLFFGTNPDNNIKWLSLVAIILLNFWVIWKSRRFIMTAKAYIDYQVYKAIEEKRRRKKMKKNGSD